MEVLPMAKQLANESLVKKALNIDSFRNLSKEKIIEFVSLIPSMDKDVAMSIINQFPKYSDCSSIMNEHIKEICEKAILSNDESQKCLYQSYKLILDNLSIILNKEDLSTEERYYVTEQMVKIADKLSVKDSENKEFHLKVIKTIVLSASVALLGCAAVLGVNIKGTRIPTLS